MSTHVRHRDETPETTHPHPQQDRSHLAVCIGLMDRLFRHILSTAHTHTIYVMARGEDGDV